MKLNTRQWKKKIYKRIKYGCWKKYHKRNRSNNISCQPYPNRKRIRQIKKLNKQEE